MKIHDTMPSADINEIRRFNGIEHKKRLFSDASRKNKGDNYLVIGKPLWYGHSTNKEKWFALNQTLKNEFAENLIIFEGDSNEYGELFKMSFGTKPGTFFISSLLDLRAIEPPIKTLFIDTANLDEAELIKIRHSLKDLTAVISNHNIEKG